MDEVTFKRTERFEIQKNNFSAPLYWYCGFCGEKFENIEDLHLHSMVKPDGECDHA